MDLETFLDKLDGVRPSGHGFVALCPGHSDGNASLSVVEGEDNKIVLKCHAGCEITDILKAMSLDLADLFAGGKHGTIGEPEMIYVYTDEQGKPIFENVRLPGKRFRQRYYDPTHTDSKADGYVYNLDDVRRVPYMLSHLAPSLLGRPVWIVEGEKDVHSMMAQGVVATSSKNWRPEWCQIFLGANVTVVADRDDVGRKSALKIRDMLQPYAGNIRVLQSKEGKDATDHFDAGWGLADFVPIRQGPRRGIVTSIQLAEGAREALAKNEIDQPGYTLIDNCSVTFRNGRMYALGAYTSDGKSRIACQLARRLATNGVRTGYFTLEMPETDIRNILIQHKGIPLYLLEAPWLLRGMPDVLATYHDAVDEIAEWNLDIAFNTKANADYIVQSALDREYEFVIVDHVHRLSWGGERGKFEAEIQKLTNLALENDIPVLMLCQLRKTNRGKEFVAYPKPSLQEFRETSVIGDDSAMALALWRQRDNTGMRFTGATDLTILKNRYTTSKHDAAGTVFLPTFDMDTQLFTIVAGGFSQAGEITDENEPDFDQDADDNEWRGLYD